MAGTNDSQGPSSPQILWHCDKARLQGIDMYVYTFLPKMKTEKLIAKSPKLAML